METEKMLVVQQEEFTWINLNSDVFGEEAAVYQKYGIDEEVLSYALDKNERAHIEYDTQYNIFVLIYNVPKLKKVDNHYETVPMTFIIKDKNLVTISNRENAYVVTAMENHLQANQTQSVFKFLFSSLFLISEFYFPLVEEMNDERQRISKLLKEKTTKKNLLELSDLETGIVYFISAVKQNAVLLEQVKTNMVYRFFNEIDKEQLEDSLIEAKQLVEMTELASDILKGISGTYNNILNNNLNDTMRILTVLSILLTVPTIVTGFFGMNMPLPLEHDLMGWLIVIGISAAGWFLLSFVLRQILK